MSSAQAPATKADIEKILSLLGQTATKDELIELRAEVKNIRENMAHKDSIRVLQMQIDALPTRQEFSALERRVISLESGMSDIHNEMNRRFTGVDKAIDCILENLSRVETDHELRLRALESV